MVLLFDDSTVQPVLHSPSWNNVTVNTKAPVYIVGKGVGLAKQLTPTHPNRMDLCRLSLLLQTAGIIVLIHMITAATAFENQGSGPNWNWSLCGE